MVVVTEEGADGEVGHDSALAAGVDRHVHGGKRKSFLPSVLPFLCEFRRRPKHNITRENVTKPSLEKLFMAHFPALKLHFFLVYFILSDIHSQCECIFMYVFVWSG